MSPKLSYFSGNGLILKRVRRLLVAVAAACAAMTAPASDIVVRHFGPEEGLAHTHIRDVTQDSRGYMWFATWTGVDRFDGYEFRNYRSFSGDSVMLDNNRIERVAEDSEGRMWVMTYTFRVYRLDPLTGRFSVASSADSLRFFSLPRPVNPVRGELAALVVDTPLSFADRDGNLWLVRKTDGVDFVTAAPGAFRFIESEALEPVGRDIHALYAAPDGKLWAASRDTRVMAYDAATGRWLGNLSPAGRLVRDPAARSGLMVYALATDAKGRLWLGTKQKQLAVLTPESSDGYKIALYREGEAGLRCGDIYDFAADGARNMWLATFGGGVARAVEGSDGRFTFEFPAGYPVKEAGRVRRLYRSPEGPMVAATTRGVVAFDPDGSKGDTAFRWYNTERSEGSALSNNDILDICRAADGSLYFSAFSGGIDRVDSVDALVSGKPCFSNRNIRDGLDVDPVLSVAQDADSGFWVVSNKAVSRYDSHWRHLATYNAGNAGRDFLLTEAEPQHVPGGRLAFGMRGGIMVIDPSAISSAATSRFAVTGLEAGGRKLYGLPGDGPLKLPRGDRDVVVRFAALDFAGASNVMYAYRLDDSEWIPLGRERVVRLPSLPSGTTRLWLRWTDAYGAWTDTPFSMEIEVPRSLREIAGDCAIGLCLLLMLGGILFSVRREYRRRKQRHLLEGYISLALEAREKPEGDGVSVVETDSDVMTRFCREVGLRYADSALRAEDMARELGVGRNELRRDVKGVLGISLEDFVRMVRVRAAASLLAGGKHNVAETAYRCGFRTPQYMAMVFKEQTGMTPKDYAARHRKKM